MKKMYENIFLGVSAVNRSNFNMPGTKNTKGSLRTPAQGLEDNKGAFPDGNAIPVSFCVLVVEFFEITTKPRSLLRDESSAVLRALVPLW